MTLEDCIEHYEDTGSPDFKTYDSDGLTIRLTLQYKHPSNVKEIYTREVVGASFELISPYDGGDNWQTD